MPDLTSRWRSAGSEAYARVGGVGFLPVTSQAFHRWIIWPFCWRRLAFRPLNSCLPAFKSWGPAGPLQDLHTIVPKPLLSSLVWGGGGGRGGEPLAQPEVLKAVDQVSQRWWEHYCLSKVDPSKKNSHSGEPSPRGGEGGAGPVLDHQQSHTITSDIRCGERPERDQSVRAISKFYS